MAASVRECVADGLPSRESPEALARLVPDGCSFDVEETSWVSFSPRWWRIDRWVAWLIAWVRGRAAEAFVNVLVQENGAGIEQVGRLRLRVRRRFALARARVRAIRVKP